MPLKRIKEFIVESTALTDERRVAVVTQAFNRMRYKFERIWVEHATEGPGQNPTVNVLMDKLAEPGPTLDSGEINYGTVSRMEMDVRNRLGLRSTPRFGQYTKEMGYPDVPEGKLLVQIDLLF